MTTSSSEPISSLWILKFIVFYFMVPMWMGWAIGICGEYAYAQFFPLSKEERVMIHVAYDTTDFLKIYPSMSNQEVVEFFNDSPEIISELPMEGVVKAFKTHGNAGNHP